VAANGPVFEARHAVQSCCRAHTSPQADLLARRLRTAEAGNPKFAFLDPAHAHHPLFRERVRPGSLCFGLLFCRLVPDAAHR
jgi:Surp module